MSPESMAVFGLVDGCSGWIVGLLLLGIGLITVRKAHPVAGYLVGAAGAMQIIASCCSSWQMPAYVWFDVDAGVGGLGSLFGILSFLPYVLTFLLVLGAGVLLSMKLTEQSKKATEQPGGGAS